MLRRFLKICALASVAALPCAPVAGEDVIVLVDGAHGVPGEIACRLYNSPRNFPFGTGTAGAVRSRRGDDGTACILRNLAPGNYALVAALLPDGQDDVTRDLLGRPRQPWGVSNNIRHALRAPRYDEAAFTVERGKTTRLRITLAK
jgi:uncharacterized protein (DUF2141 family)